MELDNLPKVEKTDQQKRRRILERFKNAILIFSKTHDLPSVFQAVLKNTGWAADFALQLDFSEIHYGPMLVTRNVGMVVDEDGTTMEPDTVEQVTRAITNGLKFHADIASFCETDVTAALRAYCPNFETVVTFAGQTFAGKPWQAIGLSCSDNSFQLLQMLLLFRDCAREFVVLVKAR